MQDVCKFHAGGNQNYLKYHTPRFNKKEKNNNCKCEKKFYNCLTAEKKRSLYPYFPVMLWFSNGFPLNFQIKLFWGCKEGGFLYSSLCCCKCPTVITGFWKPLNLLTFCWQQGWGFTSIGKSEGADLQWCLLILKLHFLWKVCEWLQETVEDRFCTGLCPAETALHGG